MLDKHWTRAMEQERPTLTTDDLLGTWKMIYPGGQAGTFTITKKTDGSPKIEVATAQGGESEADEIAIEKNMVTFARNITIGALAARRVTYTMKLVDGEFSGVSRFGTGPGTPFSVSRTGNVR